MQTKTPNTHPSPNPLAAMELNIVAPVSLTELRKIYREIGYPKDKFGKSDAVCSSLFDQETLTTNEKAFLLTSLVLFRNAGGCETPCEKFLKTILGIYARRAFGPESLKTFYSEFKLDYRCLIQDAKRALEQYRDQILEAVH